MAESSLFHSDISDGLHDNVAWDNDNESFVGTTDFDYDEIDRNVFGHEEPDGQVEYSDMVAVLSIILGWICASPDLSYVGDPVYLTGT